MAITPSGCYRRCDVSSEHSDPTRMRAHERIADGKLLNNFVWSTVFEKMSLFQFVVVTGPRIDSYRVGLKQSHFIPPQPRLIPVSDVGDYCLAGPSYRNWLAADLPDLTGSRDIGFAIRMSAFGSKADVGGRTPKSPL